MLCALALATPTRTNADIPREEFRWRVPLRGSLTSGVLYRVLIPGSVFDGSRAVPSDLRLLDDTGTDWSFFVYKPDPPEPQQRIALARMELPGEQENHSGIQTIFFDAGYRHNPLKRLELQVANSQFARPVKVFGRNFSTNQWRWMADGGVHRIDGQERNLVDLPNAGYRFLKVEVLNYEEPELLITNAYAIADPQFLVILPSRSGKAWLYFGADIYVLPRFELQHHTTRQQIEAAPLAEFAPRERNPYRIGHEIWRYSRLLLAASLCIAGVFALGLMLKRLRSG